MFLSLICLLPSLSHRLRSHSWWRTVKPCAPWWAMGVVAFIVRGNTVQAASSVCEVNTALQAVIHQWRCHSKWGNGVCKTRVDSWLTQRVYTTGRADSWSLQTLTSSARFQHTSCCGRWTPARGLTLRAPLYTNLPQVPYIAFFSVFSHATTPCRLNTQDFKFPGGI